MIGYSVSFCIRYFISPEFWEFLVASDMRLTWKLKSEMIILNGTIQEFEIRIKPFFFFCHWFMPGASDTCAILAIVIKSLLFIDLIRSSGIQPVSKDPFKSNFN